MRIVMCTPSTILWTLSTSFRRRRCPYKLRSGEAFNAKPVYESCGVLISKYLLLSIIPLTNVHNHNNTNSSPSAPAHFLSETKFRPGLPWSSSGRNEQNEISLTYMYSLANGRMSYYYYLASRPMSWGRCQK